MRAYGETEKSFMCSYNQQQMETTGRPYFKDFTPGTKSESLRGILDMMVKIKYQKFPSGIKFQL
jgi:hypothetical protein